MVFELKVHPDDTECVNATIGEAQSCQGLPCFHGICEDYETHLVCSCHQGWTGVQCDTCCMLPCENGICETDDSDSMLYCYCLPEDTYDGVYCEKPFTTEVADVTNISGWNVYTISVGSVLAVVAFILILLLVLIPYILYKQRNKMVVKYVLKIMYRLGKFEDDDSRMYDVFLSYRTSHKGNRDFVIYKLLKAIENWGYTTCIDERDFIPGTMIAETIKEAIQQSRRTILVISPAYILGEWPQFEVQCALTETLKKCHRIIPIIYEPLSETIRENMSPTLEHILESITYIEWPVNNNKKAQDDFWRRLKLSLPKLRKVQTSQVSESEV